jgi:hypothetical protein
MEHIFILYCLEHLSSDIVFINYLFRNYIFFQLSVKINWKFLYFYIGISYLALDALIERAFAVVLNIGTVYRIKILFVTLCSFIGIY